MLSAILVTGCSNPPMTIPPAPLAFHAEALLVPWRFPNLTVEVDVVEGYTRSELAWAGFASTIEAYTGRKTVNLVTETISREDGRYTMDELKEIDGRTFDRFDPGLFGANGTAYIHVLYLNGATERRDGAGFYLVGEGAIVLFPDLYNCLEGPVSACNLPSQESPRYERQILIHELGHAFGLVNCGIPMVHPREDPANPCHSSTPGSLMGPDHDAPRPTRNPGGYPTYVRDGPMWHFDEHDEEDIQAYKDANAAPA